MLTVHGERRSLARMRLTTLVLALLGASCGPLDPSGDGGALAPGTTVYRSEFGPCAPAGACLYRAAIALVPGGVASLSGETIETCEVVRASARASWVQRGSVVTLLGVECSPQPVRCPSGVHDTCAALRLFDGRAYRLTPSGLERTTDATDTYRRAP